MNHASDYIDWINAAASDLDTASFPLAAVLAEQIRLQADRLTEHMVTLDGPCRNCPEGRCPGHEEHTIDDLGCGAPLLVDGDRIPEEWDADACVCFDMPLAIAAAVLVGPASNYRKLIETPSEVRERAAATAHLRRPAADVERRAS